MTDLTGPIGFQHIENAPRDGRYVRLRFRPGLLVEDGEAIGRWQAEPDMKAGGFWSDPDGCYISPWPMFWAPRVNQ